jgi:hypothetical protein
MVTLSKVWRGWVWREIFEVNVGRTAGEACSARWNFV